jgi:hypothetical protein
MALERLLGRLAFHLTAEAADPGVSRVIWNASRSI